MKPRNEKGCEDTGGNVKGTSTIPLHWGITNETTTTTTKHRKNTLKSKWPQSLHHQLK